jgi:hypothetical protein
MISRLKAFWRNFILEGEERYEVPDDFESITARLDYLERRVKLLEDENIGFINDIYELENIIESLKYNK